MQAGMMWRSCANIENIFRKSEVEKKNVLSKSFAANYAKEDEEEESET